MSFLRNCFVPCGRVLAMVCALALWMGCETMAPQSTGTDAGVAASAGDGVGPETSPDEIRKGDKLAIEFVDLPQPMAPFEQTVREDGTITLPFDQTIVAAGKKKGELSIAIRALYVPRYFRRMTVNLKSDERYYFIGGEVKNPSQRPYTGDITVLKAIQSAGDFTDFAKRSKVNIIRANGKKLTVNADKARKDARLDLPIYPGDQVIVERRLW